MTSYFPPLHKNYKNFNPHHPCGWWLFNTLSNEKCKGFQSTPPVWVVTLAVNRLLLLIMNFNPHHPCGWWQFVTTSSEAKAGKFQSTPPVWVVTKYVLPIFLLVFNFNPHHPCGWWQDWLTTTTTPKLFQSTPPVWVVTDTPSFSPNSVCISIHTTRVGGDFLHLD